MRRLKKSEYVLAGFLTLIALIPLATTANSFGSIFAPLASLTTRQKMTIPDDLREQRRLTSEFRRLCSEKTGKDPDFVCPDINNYGGVRRFLKSTEKSDDTATGSTMEAPRMNMLKLFQLNDHQKSLIRRYQRVHKCPEGLNDYLPGFLELCQSQINKGINPLRGILNDRARIEEEKAN